MKSAFVDCALSFLRFLVSLHSPQEYFDVDVFASRLNYYADGSHWKRMRVSCLGQLFHRLGS
jgi:hypothetical protein